MLLTTSDNELQFKTPIRYIAPSFQRQFYQKFSQRLKRGREMIVVVCTRLTPGKALSGFSDFNSEKFKIIRAKISTKLKIDITTNINTNTTTVLAIALTVFHQLT